MIDPYRKCLIQMWHPGKNFCVAWLSLFSLGFQIEPPFPTKVDETCKKYYRVIYGNHLIMTIEYSYTFPIIYFTWVWTWSIKVTHQFAISSCPSEQQCLWKSFLFYFTFLNFLNNSFFQFLSKLTEKKNLHDFMVVKSKSKLCNYTTYVREFIALKRIYIFCIEKGYMTLFKLQSRGHLRM